MAVKFEQQQARILDSGALETTNSRFRAPDLGRGFHIAAEAVFTRQTQEEDYEKQLAAERLASQLPVIEKDGSLATYNRTGGTVNERKAFDRALAINYGTGIEGLINERFNEVQSDINISIPDAAARMNEYGSQLVKQAPQELQPQLNAYVQRQLTGRINAMESAQRNEDERNQVKGLVAGIEMYTEEAVSAVASQNTDAARAALNRVQTSIETLAEVRGGIAPDQAELMKRDLTSHVLSRGTSKWLVGEIMNKGTIDPFKLKEFAAALESGSDFNLPIGDGKGGVFDTYSVSKLNSSNAINEKDRGWLAQQLNQAANLYLQQARDSAKQLEMTRQFELSQTNRYFSPNSETKSGFDDIVEARINSGAWLDDRGFQDSLITAMTGLKHVPKALAYQMDQMVATNDPAEIGKVLDFYARMVQTTNKWGDPVGQDTLHKLIDGKTRVKLDAMLDAARLGMNANQIAEALNRAYATEDPEKFRDNIFNQYSVQAGKEPGGSVASMNRQIDVLWNQGVSLPPPDAKTEIQDAYFLLSVMEQGMSPVQRLEKAVELVKKSFTTSPEFLGGFSRTPADLLEDPALYGSKYDMQGNVIAESSLKQTSRAVDRYLTGKSWINDYVGIQITDLITENGIALASGVDLAGFKPKVGTNTFIRAVGQPENQMFEVWVKPDGDDMTTMAQPLVGADGRKMLFNLHAAKGQIQRNIEYNETLEAATEAAALDRKLYPQSIGMQRGGDSEMLIESLMDPKSFPEDVQQEMSQRNETSKDVIDRYARENNPAPGNTSRRKVGDQKLLFESRAVGRNVVKTVAQEIDRVFPDGTGGVYLERVAAAESDYGLNKDTFRLTDDTSIWQINIEGNGAFREVQRLARNRSHFLSTWADMALEKWKVDVRNAKPHDLDQPLVAGLFARFYTAKFAGTGAMPTDVVKQAQFWKRHYNTKLGRGKVEDFIEKAGS